VIKRINEKLHPNRLEIEEEKVGKLRYTNIHKYPWIFAIVGAFAIVITPYRVEKPID